MMAYHEYFPMAEGKEELSSYVDNIGTVGGESKGAKDLFQDIDAGGTDFGGIYVGDDHLRGPGPGGFPTQGSSKYHWEASLEVIVRDMGVSTSGDGNTGGGV